MIKREKKIKKSILSLDRVEKKVYYIINKERKKEKIKSEKKNKKKY